MSLTTYFIYVTDRYELVVKISPYCGFYSVTDRDAVPSYFRALNKEIMEQPVICSAELGEDDETVYYGGGTPSFADASLICDSLPGSIRSLPA